MVYVLLLQRIIACNKYIALINAQKSCINRPIIKLMLT
jgi:hypothetical protein